LSGAGGDVIIVWFPIIVFTMLLGMGWQIALCCVMKKKL
jgi:hypothetical protein